MNILITGFNRFGNIEYNPSQILVEELERRKFKYNKFRLTTSVLPTEFKKAEYILENLISTVDPDIILLTGVSSHQKTILLERFALNIDDTELPDNIGYKPKGEKIKIKGSAAYEGSLPLEFICDKINKLDVDIQISNHAGTYVCNHVYYIACHLMSQLNKRFLLGFVHVPFAALNKNINDIHSLSISKLINVIESLIVLLYEYYKVNNQSINPLKKY